ncbi:hypothetical protein [uncultured Metabacillus sp.]|uniref:hypothetical protein n=1 Tax=uncultured Metabacillus sp. TaxID=2860135 RepID=UPI002630791C|nr:hypothetical protein [uncultured Metabacillus sp.]
MSEKDEFQKNEIKYSIWNTKAEEIHLEENVKNRANSFKKSMNKLGEAAKMDDEVN